MCLGAPIYTVFEFHECTELLHPSVSSITAAVDIEYNLPIITSES